MAYNRGTTNRNSEPQVKRSGAVYSQISKGKFEGGTIINAWNKSKAKGLITATVAPYHKSKTYKSSKGHKYQTMICKVKYTNTGIEKIIPVSMNILTGTVAIPDMGMVITKNGSGFTSGGKRVTGYFGGFNK